MGNTKNTFEKKLIMLTLVILSASLIAYAAADHHTKYTCTEWSAIPGETGTGFTATGTANVNQADDMKLTMELKQLVIQKDGADAVGDFIAHVHDGACADGGGGHWKKTMVLRRLLPRTKFGRPRSPQLLARQPTTL